MTTRFFFRPVAFGFAALLLLVNASTRAASDAASSHVWAEITSGTGEPAVEIVSGPLVLGSWETHPSALRSIHLPVKNGSFGLGAENVIFSQVTVTTDSQSATATDAAADTPQNAAAEPELPPGNATAVSPEARRFQYNLRLGLRSVYDDNIFLDRIGRKYDLYTSIEPGITIGFGDIQNREENYLRFDYQADIFFFKEHSDLDSVQHLIRLDSQYRFSRLTLVLTQDVQILDGSDVNVATNSGGNFSAVNLDVSGRTDLRLYTTQLGANYSLTGKTSLSGNLQFVLSDYSSLISSRTYSGSVFFNYAYSPKFVIGVGGSGGYSDPDEPSPAQTFEQANLRLAYDVSGKVNLAATAGVEFRQFAGESRGGYVTPVFELGATYKPFEGTTLTLTGNRRVLNSAVFQQQDYVTTGISFGVRQRLLQRFSLSLNLGYEHSEYISTAAGISASRADNYYFVQPAVDVILTRFWTVGLYYNHRENSTTDPSFGFTNNQVGLRTSISF